ncbi:hypothetical protein LZ30DRAFT_60212 [Colletotrichum cereale]|nr:hypothetical protein LZ30DRAFT_60212 [Colletotrichum cereale]
MQRDDDGVYVCVCVCVCVGEQAAGCSWCATWERWRGVPPHIHSLTLSLTYTLSLYVWVCRVVGWFVGCFLLDVMCGLTIFPFCGMSLTTTVVCLYSLFLAREGPAAYTCTRRSYSSWPYPKRLVAAPRSQPKHGHSINPDTIGRGERERKRERE